MYREIEKANFAKGAIMKINIKKDIALLTKHFHTKISWSGSFIRPMTFFGNIDEDSDNKIESHMSYEENRLISYFSNIHGWIPANPSKKDTIEALNNLYVKDTVGNYFSLITGEEKASVFANDLNPKNEHLLINDIIDTHDFIILAGLKGVGKTTFVNWWLNNNTKDLEKKKIFWFRVDASKLYKLWNDYEPIMCDLFRYYKVHLIYVVSKYSMESEDYDINPHFANMIKKIGEIEKDKNIIHVFQEIILRLQDNPKQTEQFFYKIFSESMQQKLTGGARKSLLDYCDTLYDRIETYFLNKDLTMLFIVDGVDNISWKSGKKKYDILISDLAKYVSGSIEIPVKCKIKRLVVIRNETIADLFKVRPHDSHHRDNIIPFVCEICPPKIEKVLEKKAQVADKPKSNILKQEKESLLSDIIYAKKGNGKGEAINYLSSGLDQYKDYSKSYFAGLAKAIKYKYAFVDRLVTNNNWSYKPHLTNVNWENKDEILAILFNCNIRACVDNSIENYRTIQLAKKRSILGADSFMRLPIYLLTNGRFFLDTPHQAIRIKGNSYPNIFWWDEEETLDTPYQWYGLCTLRLLQFASKNKVISSDLKEVIQTLFYYKPSIVESAFVRGIQYGLLNIVPKKSNSTSCMKDNNDSFIVTISQKGQFVLDYIFMYPEWLYICALDTPLDKKCVRNSKQLAIYRDLNLNFLTTYNVAFIKTLPTFIRHILTQHKIDMKKLKTNVSTYLADNPNNKIQCFLDVNDALSTFNIPPFFTRLLGTALGGFYSKLIKRDYNAAKDLSNDILGEYQKKEYRN
jgi:GTPase SAR1 family protein